MIGSSVSGGHVDDRRPPRVAPEPDPRRGRPRDRPHRGRRAARQNESIELIASENFTSRAVLEAVGSVLTNKYAEGYPGKRYYGGCELRRRSSRSPSRARRSSSRPENPDAIHANVQPHSGSQANTAVYLACLKPGDTMLGMSLAHGGHLTHGHPLSISGQALPGRLLRRQQETETIDYDEFAAIAEAEKPKLIIAGASAYPRTLDFPRFREIADSVGALLMVDMAHIAGLVATGLHPSPVGHAHFMTTTTHKTLRGPRAGLILCTPSGPRRSTRPSSRACRAGRSSTSSRARPSRSRKRCEPEFARIPEGGRRNAKVLAEAWPRRLPDRLGRDRQPPLPRRPREEGADGKVAEKALDKAGITVNKNAIPFDPNPPLVTSGLRIGTPGRHDARHGTRRDADDRRLDRGGPRVPRGRGRPGERQGAGQGADEAFPLY